MSTIIPTGQAHTTLATEQSCFHPTLVVVSRYIHTSWILVHAFFHRLSCGFRFPVEFLSKVPYPFVVSFGTSSEFFDSSAGNRGSTYPTATTSVVNSSGITPVIVTFTEMASRVTVAVARFTTG